MYSAYYGKKVKNSINVEIHTVIYSEYGDVAYDLIIDTDVQILTVHSPKEDYREGVGGLVIKRTEDLTGNLALDSVTLTRYFNNKLLEAI